MTPDYRIFAFGDVHGEVELLTLMLEKIKTEVASAPGPTAHIIGVGDYIDRGLGSAEVLDLLVNLSRDKSITFTALKGNHEDVFLQFLDRPVEVGQLWMEIGGEETLRSYGVLPARRSAGAEFLRIREDLGRRLPPSHLGFLLGLRTHLAVGDFFFCHAGVRAGIPLEKQSDQDLMWLRNNLAKGDSHLEKIVIHGHRAVREPELRPYRINVDTGAYLTGVLSCVVLEQNQIRTIQVSHSSGAESDANPANSQRTNISD